MTQSTGLSVDEIIAQLGGLVAVADSQKAVAENLGVSTQYLNDVLRRRREPGDKILRAIGYQRVVTYKRTSVREPPEAAAIRQQAATVKALAADKAAEERQAARYEAYRLTAQWWRVVRG